MIAVAEANQAQISDVAILTIGGITITPAEANQAQTSDAANITATYVIATAEANQTQVSDAAVFGVYYVVTVADGTQAQVSDLAILSEYGIVLHGTRILHELGVREDSVFATRPTHKLKNRNNLEVDD